MRQICLEGERLGAATGLRAVILAGGKGTWLAPFTINFPKPLVPIGDVPVLEILLWRLVQHGITDVTLCLGHLAELIKSYLDHRKELREKIRFQFVDEVEPTGTAGSLSLVPGLTGTFLCMNGDLLTTLNLHELVQFHRDQKAVLTIASHAREVQIDLGVLQFDGDFRLTGYIEKPKTTHFVSMGIYVYESSVLHYIEPGKYLDFPDLVLRLIQNGERVCGFPSKCRWLDIGRPDDYARAQAIFAEKRADFDVV